MQKIVLASKSPRRKQLLEWADVPFEINVVDTDESFPSNFLPADAAIHIAENKALAVVKQFPGNPVLSADTIVVLDGVIIGKPVDRQDAINILNRLSGRVHHVITGVCILTAERKITFAETTEVEFHSLTREEIIFYIDNYKPYDKAGAYAIQEWIGVVGIKSIEGDFYNVMGLPVSRVVRELKNL
jgi:septum formation protein